MRDLLPILNERHANAEPKQRPFIDADIARVRELAGDLPAPAPTPHELEEIERLSPRQQQRLAAILNGTTTYTPTEKGTIAALQRRGLLTITIDDTQRFPLTQLQLTPQGAQLIAQREARPDALVI